MTDALLNYNKKSAKEIGTDAESIAIKFLQKNGYKIVERNYNTKFGEIDVVALDGKTVAFVEVKFRKSGAYGAPYEFVTSYKKNRLQKAAWCYIKQRSLADMDLRFDIISITGAKVDLFKNAFV